MGDAETVGSKPNWMGTLRVKAGGWVGGLFVVLFLLEIVFFRIAYAAVPGLIGTLTPYVRVFWTRCLFLLAVLSFSLGLFACRQRYREFYGLTEIAFGCVTAWSVMPSCFESDSNWPAFLGAMYINVRGLDNWRSGREARLKAGLASTIGPKEST